MADSDEHSSAARRLQVRSSGLEADAVLRVLEGLELDAGVELVLLGTGQGEAAASGQTYGDESPPVVVVWASGDPAVVRSLLLAGAAAVLGPDADCLQLRSCLVLAAAGHHVLPRDAGVVAEWRRSRADDRGNARGRDVVLTARETEVLRALASGLTGKAVAKQLQVSLKTVEAHKSNLFAKLGVANQTQAVSVGLRAGLV